MKFSMNQVLQDTTTTEPKYAHMVNTTITNFDVTFVFYQIMPVQVGNDDNANPVIEQKQVEVSRVTVPKKVAKDFEKTLSGLLNQKK